MSDPPWPRLTSPYVGASIRTVRRDVADSAEPCAFGRGLAIALLWSLACWLALALLLSL